MLYVRWQSIKFNGDAGVEEFSTAKFVRIESGNTWFTVKEVETDKLLLMIPAWRIIEVTQD